MTIHHATIKRAAKLGFVLTEVDTGSETVARCHWAELNREFFHADPKQAIEIGALCRMLRTEYPRLDLKQNKALEISVLTVDGRTILPYSHDLPDISVVVERCQQMQIDLEEDEDPYETVVVAPHYKEQYKERGNPNHCGDWLAQQLDGRFVVKTDEGERFDVDKFTETLVLNGVDMSGKWAGLPESGQKGWIGRYRMNGRQKLEVQVAITGQLDVVVAPNMGKCIPVPQEALKQLREKHAKAVARAQKETEK